MAKKYGIVLGTSQCYLPGINALMHSLLEYGHDDCDVYFVDYDLSREYIDLLCKDVMPVFVYDRRPGEGGWEATAYRRWEVAADLADKHEAVCVLDADMFCLRNLEIFLQMAARSDVIIGASNNMNHVYGKNWNEKAKFELFPGDKEIFNSKTVTNVPIFFNPKTYGYVFKKIPEFLQTNKTLSDFELMNVFIANTGNLDNMIVLPSHCWTGIHHSFLKPETRFRMIRDEAVSENGEPIYMAHGKWWDEAWYKDLITPMRTYIKEYSCDRQWDRVEDSRLVILKQFAKFSNSSIINSKGFYKHSLEWIDELIK